MTGELTVVEREFGELALNMGPQHPSTHGVLRLVLHLSGETIVRAIPHMGYLHRGVEKLSESLAWDQLPPIFERDDYLSPTSNSLGFCVAAERLGRIELPRRAAWLRTLMAELGRVSSHLVWLGTFGLDLGGALGGGTTVYMYCFRERELILDLLEELTGTRFHTNFNLIGGCRYDLEPTVARKISALCERLEEKLEELWDLTGRTALFEARTRGVGVLSREDAEGFGVTGPVLRASGIGFDVRRAAPYDAYTELDFQVAVRSEGDAYARFEVRMEEIRQALGICRQIVEGLPSGPIFSRRPLKNPKAFKLPPGEVYAAVESPRGELGFYLVSDGGSRPHRLKIRAPSFANLQAVGSILPGHLLADAVAVLGSLDPVLGDVDR